MSSYMFSCRADFVYNSSQRPWRRSLIHLFNDPAAKSTTDLKILRVCSEIGSRYRMFVADLAAGLLFDMCHFIIISFCFQCVLFSFICSRGALSANCVSFQLYSMNVSFWPEPPWPGQKKKKYIYEDFILITLVKIS